jgi:hypothetical protein
MNLSSSYHANVIILRSTLVFKNFASVKISRVYNLESFVVKLSRVGG